MYTSPVSNADPSGSCELQAIMRHQQLDTHFQPLFDVDRQQIFGFEALTRGPVGSALHAPLALFEAAARAGRLVELERLALRRAVKRFCALDLPGRLFLNVTADTLSAADDTRVLQVATELEQLGLAPQRIVIELTETRATTAPRLLQRNLAALRELGFAVALDDLGEGFASLRRWIELRPDFVKIDRYFVDGIAADPIKQQFMRSLLDMARSAACTLVAEGLEKAEDLSTLRALGVTLCQGFLLGRPSAHPAVGRCVPASANAQIRLTQRPSQRCTALTA
jgi:EAL domain-containing protein (putative c-di-GMP-specific phosphodiesterase class I)